MRVAVLSDIHGNLPALEAVLAEPDVAAADRVVLLGDIALGPLPAESLDLLASLGERAVWVHGNCEREVVAAYDGTPPPGPERRQRPGDRRPARAAPPRPARRAAADGVPRRRRARARRCSATRRRAATTRWRWSTARSRCGSGRWRVSRSAGRRSATPTCRSTGWSTGRRVVNPGSVGMSYGARGACWALLGPTVSAATHGVRRRGGGRADRRRRVRPDAAAWAQEYVLAPPGDVEALEAFTELVDPLP